MSLFLPATIAKKFWVVMTLGVIGTDLRFIILKVMGNF